MNTLSITLKLALCGSLLILFSCTPREEATENSQAATFETIELGANLEDARALLAGQFSEFKIGETPDVDVIIFKDGRQLVFKNNILTDKNTSEEIDQAIHTRMEATN